MQHKSDLWRNFVNSVESEGDLSTNSFLAKTAGLTEFLKLQMQSLSMIKDESSS